MPDDLTIVANGQLIRGWTEISITRSIEHFPSSFELGLTERYPGTTVERTGAGASEAVVITPGTPCQVMLGADLVLTGYTDEYTASIGPTSHDVRIRGRSKCEDLVDCSAFFGAGGEQAATPIANQTITQIASALCAPFGITVTNRSGDDGPIIPLQVISLGETPYEIIERMARWVGLLLYDDTDGNLVLDRVGSTTAPGGLIQGSNAQNATFSLRTDERYSDYLVVWNSVSRLADVAGEAYQQHGVAHDPVLPTLPRFRPLYIVSSLIDGTQQNWDLGQRVADWEANRRYGRSQPVVVTTDSWRDADGKLWQPNSLLLVNIPAIKVQNKLWCIASVTFSRSLGTGTTAQLTLMPPEAFAIEPISLGRVDRDILAGMASTTAPPAEAPAIGTTGWPNLPAAPATPAETATRSGVGTTGWPSTPATPAAPSGASAGPKTPGI